jgi:hypothetical protein
VSQLLSVDGRSTEYVFYKNLEGEYEKFNPFTLVPPLLYFSELRQYQIVQTDRNELTLFYVLQKNSADIKEQLSRTVNDSLEKLELDKLIDPKLKQVDSIDRNKRTGKFQVIKSLGPPT